MRPTPVAPANSKPTARVSPTPPGPPPAPSRRPAAVRERVGVLPFFPNEVGTRGPAQTALRAAESDAILLPVPVRIGLWLAREAGLLPLSLLRNVRHREA